MTESTQDFVTDFPLLKQIVNLAQEKKAVQLVAMDVRGLSSITDYFVICSGDSEPQVKAIADNIRKGTPKKPNHLEGYENLNWVLMDYFDVVVTNEQCNYNKPHPEPYIKALVKLGSLPQDSIIVEDSPKGIESAIRSGCLVIGVAGCDDVNIDIFDEILNE